VVCYVIKNGAAIFAMLGWQAGAGGSLGQI